MPYRRFFEAFFDPKAVAAMTAAYDRTIRDLQVADENDPRRQAVAKRIIELAAAGEVDPIVLAPSPSVSSDQMLIGYCPYE